MKNKTKKMNLSPDPKFKAAQKETCKRKRSDFTVEPVERYFNKKFSFKFNNEWCLPEPEWIYRSDRWHVTQLQEMKDELNRVKGQLEEFDLEEWSQHTKRRDKAGAVFKELKKVVKPELLTQVRFFH